MHEMWERGYKIRKIKRSQIMENFVCQTRTFRSYFIVNRVSLVTQMIKNLPAMQET